MTAIARATLPVASTTPVMTDGEPSVAYVAGQQLAKLAETVKTRFYCLPRKIVKAGSVEPFTQEFIVSACEKRNLKLYARGRLSNEGFLALSKAIERNPYLETIELDLKIFENQEDRAQALIDVLKKKPTLEKIAIMHLPLDKNLKTFSLILEELACINVHTLDLRNLLLDSPMAYLLKSLLQKPHFFVHKLILPRVQGSDPVPTKTLTEGLERSSCLTALDLSDMHPGYLHMYMHAAAASHVSEISFTPPLNFHSQAFLNDVRNSHFRNVNLHGKLNKNYLKELHSITETRTALSIPKSCADAPQTCRFAFSYIGYFTCLAASISIALMYLAIRLKYPQFSATLEEQENLV